MEAIKIKSSNIFKNLELKSFFLYFSHVTEKYLLQFNPGNRIVYSFHTAPAGIFPVNNTRAH